ncbi:MAG: efflux RND transporter periplasmic adaptor subunit [Balneola sp.]
MTKSILSAVLLLSLLLIGCGGDAEESNPAQNARFSGWGGGAAGGRITSVETEAVTRQPIADQVRSFGTIKAQDVVAITPQVSNRIVKLYADLGDTVRQGQLLAKIYDTTFRDQLQQAKAQLAQSKVAIQRDSTQFARQQKLLESNAISQSEYDNAFATYRSSLSQYQSSVASVTQAQENFNNTEVRSPVRGVVISRTGAEGDIASAGQTLFEVANLVGYETRIYLPVQDWKAVKIGQSVNLRVSNEAESSANGVVSRKSPQLDATTGLGEVVITLTEIGSSIYPGVLTENVIDIVNKPSAIVIKRSSLVEKVETVVEPESNTIQLDRTYSVFISNGDSVAVLRKLELGIEQGDKIEILSGLRPGESIVVTGQQSLEDGGSIRVASGSTFQSPQGQSVADDGQNRQARQGGNRAGQGGNAFQNMSEEDRAKMRQRMQNMSQEERRAFMDSVRTANASGN